MGLDSKLLALLAFLFFSLSSVWSAPEGRTAIHLHRVLGSDYACTLYQRPVQFVSEDELLLMAGPSAGKTGDRRDVTSPNFPF